MSAKKIQSKNKTAKRQPGSRKKAQGRLIFALDIGTRNVVGIVGQSCDGVFSVLDCESCAHSKRAMKDGQIEEIEEVARIVKRVKEELERRLNIRLSSVSIAAAGRALKTQTASLDIDIPSSEPISEELERSLEIEAVSLAQNKLDKQLKNEGDTSFYCVGHSVVSFSLDGYPMKSLIGHRGKKARIEVIAAFLPSPVVESLYAVTEKNKLKVSSLTLEPIAAMNVIIPPEIRLINIALVDIGAGTSDIAVSQGGSIVAYAMATVAGDEITEEIIQKYLVDFQTAEQMKLSSRDSEIVYSDILGIEHKIGSAEFFKSIYPAVDTLADTVAGNIIQANGTAPAAIFLVGGGSLIPDLGYMIAKKLDMPESRVAVGGHSFIKNVVLGSSEISGPEYVTPVGIAVTATLQKGYDFSTLTLNERRFRVFDTKSMTILDLLMLGGFKTRQIIGHNGKNLTFSLNGQTVSYKGSVSSPAQLFLNGKPASLDTAVSHGDDVRIIPAVSGESAHVLASELSGELLSGKIILDGKEYSFGTSVLVNLDTVNAAYEIKNGDEVKVSSVLTLYELLAREGIDRTGFRFRRGKGILSSDVSLSDGDVFFSEKQAEKKTALQTDDTASKLDLFNIEASPLNITLNGKAVALPNKQDGTPHLFLEVLPLMNLDLSNPTGSVVMLINGKEAQYMSRLHENDDIKVFFAE